MSRLLTLLSVLSALCACALSHGEAPVAIGPGFWNVRGSFKISVMDIGAQMSLAKLASGKYLVFDTIALTPSLLDDINALTNNGSLIEAVIATHPFHTVYFPDFYKAFPNVPYYGTPRHLGMQPQIPWAGSVYDCEVRQKWSPEIRMRIPRGSEFENPPYPNIHFTGMHVLHSASGTVHVDDTIMVDVPFSGNMLFHPTLLVEGLYHLPEAPIAFESWVKKMLNDWEFDNIVAAHNGVRVGGAKAKLQHLLSLNHVPLYLLSKTYSISPNATDATAFARMEQHESLCKE